MAADTTSSVEPLDVFRDPDFVWATRWIRADGLAMFVGAASAVTFMHGRWSWFLGLFLLPDLSMAGYLFGGRAGAVAYNTGHMMAWPLTLLGIGLVTHGSLATTAALSWIAHIAFDHTVGYGLKLPTGFEHTTLGRIARSRTARNEVDRASPAATER